MRGAVFFSTCASIGDEGLSGRKKILRDSPVLARRVVQASQSP